MASRIAPVGQLDLLDSTGNRLVMDADLDGSGNAIAILLRAGGDRFSITLDPRDVRALAEWSAQVVGLARHPAGS